MKTHTSNYKNAIKSFGRELDSKITYTQNGTQLELGSEELNSITPHYEGGILKSVMKQLDIDSNVEIPLGTILTYQFGVKVGNQYEYINFGNYIVNKVEKQEDTDSWFIVCYDKMLYSMKDYESLGITYPITVRNYITAICNKIGLVFKYASSGTFANYAKTIPNELYLDEDGKTLGYTYRDVLDELAEVTASTICINENDDELEIRYINNTNDTIDEEYLKDVNVNFGEKYGPVNTIVLSRSGGADNIYYPSTLPSNPIEIKISDNQILNGNNRDEFIANIYNKLNGLEYYINDFSSTGITYYNLCDRYNVQIGDNTYSCVMFNDEVNITQGLEENVYTEMPEDAETDYKKSDTTDRRINQTTLIVDKQQSEITALVDTTQDIQKEINPTQDEIGTSFYLEDSTDAELVNFELEGKTTQETSTQGANLFDEDYYRNATYDTGVYKYTLSKITGNSGVLYTKAQLKSGKTKINGLYICLCSKNNPNISGAVYSWFMYNSDLTASTKSINTSGLNELYFSFYPTNISISDIFDTYNFWVSTDNINYEPFVPDMPSPDYPSELVSVGYQNLFDNNSVRLNTTWNNTAQNGRAILFIETKPNTTYTISANNWNNLFYDIEFLDHIGSTTSLYSSGWNNPSSVPTKTFTTTSGTNILGIHFKYQSAGSTTMTREMFENATILLTKGTQEHSYIPYGKYGIEIKTRGNNLLKGMSTPKTDEYWIDASSQYFTPLENGWGKFEINNTSGSSTAFINAKVRVGQIDLKPNTLYTIVAEIRNGNISANSGCFFQLCTANPTASWKTAKSIGYASINAGGKYIFTSTTKESFEGMASYFDSYLRIAAGYSGSLEIRVSLIEGTYSLDKFEYEPYISHTNLIALNQPLRSIGDTKDLLYIKNGMLYVERKIGSVDLSTITWNKYGHNVSGYSRYSSTTIPNIKYVSANTQLGNGMAEKYVLDVGSGITSKIDKIAIDVSQVSVVAVDSPTGEFIYELAEPNTEGLGKVEVPSTYKTITHIDTTDELEPNMNITYVRDTQLTNYVEQHISQIVVNEEGITERVQTIEDSDYDSRINAVEQKQTDTDLTIDIISTNIDKTNGNIQEVTTTTGFTFNAEGMTIEDSSSQFKAQHRVDGTYYKDGDTIVGQYTKDGSKQKDLSLFGVYYYGMNDIDDTPMFVAQLYTDNNGEEGFGHFPNRSD